MLWKIEEEVRQCGEKIVVKSKPKGIKMNMFKTQTPKSAFMRAAALVITAGALVTQNAKAQQIYKQTFNTDDSANWAVNYSYNCTDPNWLTISNQLTDFNFDYTTAGIPLAPHSSIYGSAAIHHGLKMSAVYTNLTANIVAKGSAATAGISATPLNFSVTADFVMHADMWINVNCAPYSVVDTNYADSTASFATTAHNGSASTVLYGCGYGTAGTVATTPGVTDAIFVGTTTDNGSSAQIRMYGPSTIGQSSYQNGTYQSTGTATPGFTGDPLVYNIGNTPNGAGARAMVSTTLNPPYTASQLSTNLASSVAWRDIFPSSAVPLQQQILYPQQTNNYSIPGLLTFGWHDVSVEKIGTVIVYKIDGNILATGNYSSAGTPSGSLLTFVASRTGLSAASAATSNYTNLNFVVFANIVVSNYANVVNVSASQPTCQEGIPGTPGLFTLTRSSAGVPLTVNYTLAGTATNGSQYTVSGGTTTSVTFSSTATSTNVVITPVDDGIPEPTHTVILTLQSGTGYAGAGNAVVSILDGDTPTVDITAPSGAQAYGRYTGITPGSGNNDYIPFTLTRRGLLTTGSALTVNLSYGGTAVGGTDYSSVSSVNIPDGAQTANLAIVPLNNPATTSNLTVIANVTSVTGGAVGASPATGTIISANYAVTAPVLLTDALTDSSSTETQKWYVVYGTGDPVNDATNYSADFGYSLASDPAGNLIPPPPGGNTHALHLTCNKQNAVNPAPGAVNCYFTNLLLSGNYAVRFNMNVVEAQGTANATEGPVFGINHSGSLSNWWYGAGTLAPWTWSSDGIWYWIDPQAGGTVAGDYQEYTGQGGTNANTGWTRVATGVASTFGQAFKNNDLGIYGPFTCYDGFGNHSSGIPANGSSVTDDDSTWSDVEIKQIDNIVTMSINHTPIFAYTNTTVWTNGYLMLGYADPYGASIAGVEAGVYYANLQVVQLPATINTTVTINKIAVSGGNVVITFTTSNPADTTSSFTLQSSGTVGGAYSGVSPAASITSLGSNQFQATTPYLAGTQLFYRIQHP